MLCLAYIACLFLGQYNLLTHKCDLDLVTFNGNLKCTFHFVGLNISVLKKSTAVHVHAVYNGAHVVIMYSCNIHIKIMIMMRLM